MSEDRKMSRIEYLFLVLIGSVIMSTVALTLEKGAEAQGASYVRQNNPVDRQSHQLVPAEITDAGTDAYSARMRSAFKSSALRDVHAVAFGDLFLEDLREFRTQRLAEVGMSPLFPLWNRDTHDWPRRSSIAATTRLWSRLTHRPWTH